jgi:SAM-dependent methyltransferase
MLRLSDMPAVLACPLCRCVIPDGACTRCGAYPTVGGVWIALPEPGAALAALRASMVGAWAESQVAAAASASHHDASPHQRADEGRAVAAIAKNQELLAAIVEPALASAPARGAVKARRELARLIACDNVWPFAETLPYFYADWCAAASDARDLILADVAHHRPPPASNQSALVLGSAGGRLVAALATLLGAAHGIDRSIAPLLLSRRLLDGETFTAHLEEAGWRPCVLRGAERTSPGVTLVAGDAAALPFADGSFEVVVSQYLLDIVHDPAHVMAEINRVLAPGGIWVNLGLPFRLRDQPTWLPRCTGDGWDDLVTRFGFDVVTVSRHPVAHRALGELDPWAAGEMQQAIHAVVRKVSSLPIDPTEAALRAYFAGDPRPLSLQVPMLREPVEVRVRRGPRGNVMHRAIHLGRARMPMPDERALDVALSFLDTLDGATPFPAIVHAAQAEERDAALALEALRRAGFLAPR